MGERTGAYRILVGNLNEDLGIDESLQEVEWRTGLDRSGSGYVQVVCPSECGNELWVPKMQGILLPSCGSVVFCRRTLSDARNWLFLVGPHIISFHDCAPCRYVTCTNRHVHISTKIRYSEVVFHAQVLMYRLLLFHQPGIPWNTDRKKLFL
jgi:hypothetical protein